MKQEEITIIEKRSPTYVTWSVMWKIIVGLVALAGWVYGVRATAIADQFSAQDKKIESITDSLNEHIRIQNQNELQEAQSLGRIEQALGITPKK